MSSINHHGNCLSFRGGFCAVSNAASGADCRGNLVGPGCNQQPQGVSWRVCQVMTLAVIHGCDKTVDELVTTLFS